MKPLSTSLLLSLLLTSIQPSFAVSAQNGTAKAETVPANAILNRTSHEKDPWWQHAVLYEIYPRSFQDSNGDGIGDLNGITSKLDYLKTLGVDAIWLTPCYPSPQVDFGYDISDYCNIAPEYGTLADFDRLMAAAKKRGIKVIMDLVMNHTSDKHPWFIESSSSKTNPKRDWYIWKDGKNGGPPNNWQSVFGHSAWALDSKTGQYYYHLFYPQQPDLNYRNPEVRKAMGDVARFWLDRGVAGFRLDAITTLFEESNLTDNPTKEGVNVYGDPNMENKYNDRLAEVHDVLKELRQIVNSYPGDRVLVGETGGVDVAQLSEMYGKNADEIQLPMNFFFPDVSTLSAPDFRKQIILWDQNPAKGWPVYVLSNHDRRRHYSRYADGANNDKIAKILGTMLLTLRGTPILYYGEEIGMENYDPQRKEDVLDPIGKIGWPKDKGRDGERTPMQWSDSLNAGFTTGHPWLPVALNYPTHNVFNESHDKASLLEFYEKLMALRRKNSAFIHGSYVSVNDNDPNVLSYLRQSKTESVLVVLNMSKNVQTQKFDLSAHGIKATTGKVILSSTQEKPQAVRLDAVSLQPFEVQLIQLK